MPRLLRHQGVHNQQLRDLLPLDLELLPPLQHPRSRHQMLHLLALRLRCRSGLLRRRQLARHPHAQVAEEGRRRFRPSLRAKSRGRGWDWVHPSSYRSEPRKHRDGDGRKPPARPHEMTRPDRSTRAPSCIETAVPMPLGDEAPPTARAGARGGSRRTAITTGHREYEQGHNTTGRLARLVPERLLDLELEARAISHRGFNRLGFWTIIKNAF